MCLGEEMRWIEITSRAQSAFGPEEYTTFFLCPSNEGNLSCVNAIPLGSYKVRCLFPCVACRVQLGPQRLYNVLMCKNPTSVADSFVIRQRTVPIATRASECCTQGCWSRQTEKSVIGVP